jgi:hypothetical protein
MESVRAQAGARDLVLLLGGGTSATVTVLDPTGAPVPGARVAAQGDPAASGRTAADGRVRLEGLDPASPYELRATGERWLPGTVVPWAPSDVVVRLRAPAEVAGVVVDAEGRPITGARVTGSTATESDSEWADEHGAFALRGLSGGPCALVVRTSGFLPEQRYEVNAPASGVSVVASRGSSVEVALLGGSGAQTEYELAGGFGDDLSTESSSVAGDRIALDGLGPGRRYAVLVRQEALCAMATGFAHDAGRIELRLAPGQSVTGRVVGPGREAPDWKRVSASAHGITVDGSFAEDGSYVVDRLPPGRWIVDVRARVAGTYYEGTVEVRSGASADVTLSRAEE